MLFALCNPRRKNCAFSYGNLKCLSETTGSKQAQGMDSFLIIRFFFGSSSLDGTVNVIQVSEPHHFLVATQTPLATFPAIG